MEGKETKGMISCLIRRKGLGVGGREKERRWEGKKRERSEWMEIGDNDLEAQETVPAGLSQDLASVVCTPSF